MSYYPDLFPTYIVNIYEIIINIPNDAINHKEEL